MTHSSIIGPVNEKRDTNQLPADLGVNVHVVVVCKCPDSFSVEEHRLRKFDVPTLNERNGEKHHRREPSRQERSALPALLTKCHIDTPRSWALPLMQ